MIWANNYHSIQVNIPRNRSSKSYLTQLKCQATSDTTHSVLIGKEIGYKSYKEICSGEPKKVNLGFNNDPKYLNVENNTLLPRPERKLTDYISGTKSAMLWNWEPLGKFFKTYNIEPNWLDCGFSWGSYDEEMGGWTGCMGKV